MKSQLLTKLFATQAGLSSLVLRVPVGVILMAHGSQKLFGWFGGYGLQGTGQWMESLGMHPGVLMAGMAGSAEFFGGLALILGLLIRPAALVAAFTMVMAILSVHISNGLFLANNGYEYALALLVALLALAIQGSGLLSVDKLIATRIAAKR